jgi:diazepam-binding inhibitor (GABA receptor modulating acyl-CoA-binding protein)
MSIEAKFKVFAERSKTLKYVVDEDLAILYGNYKQSLFGDNTTDAPFFLQFQAVAKWNAWNACKGKSKEEAMLDYIAKVSELVRLESKDDLEITDIA